MNVEWLNADTRITSTANEMGNILFVRKNLEAKIHKNSVKVTNISDEMNSHISPGGRGDKGFFAFDMTPGKKYYAKVDVVMDKQLKFPLADHHLEINVDIRIKDKIIWGWEVSPQAPNIPGKWTIGIQFQIPENASGGWFRLQMGAGKGSSVCWENFKIFELENNFPLYNPYYTSEYFNDLLSLEELKYNISPFKKILLELIEFHWCHNPKVVTHILDTNDLKDLINFLVKCNCDMGLNYLAEYLYVTKQQNKILSISNDMLENTTFLFKEYLYLYLKKEQSVAALDRKMIETQNELNNIDWDEFANRDKGKRFEQRIQEKEWLTRNLEVIKMYKFIEPIDITDNIPVFVYWNTGIDNAPYIVKRNIERLKKYLPSQFQLHILDDNNINYYLQIPSQIQFVHDQYIAAYSDYIRIALLDYYGGIWIDSTVFVKEEFNQYMTEINSLSDKNIIIIPTYTRNRIGSWFIMSLQKHNYGIQLMHRALDQYWLGHAELPEYFMFHTFWEILVQTDETLNKIWYESPKISAGKATYIVRHIYDNMYINSMKDILHSSPVHKLTYKYDSNKMKPGTIGAYMLSELSVN